MSVIHTIVAGVAGLTPEDPTLSAATELARGAGAALHLVHAYEIPHLHGFHRPGALAEYEAEVRATLAGAIDGRFGREPVCHAVHGTAAEAILRVAVEGGASLVLVGAGHHPGRLAPTAARVLRDAKVPVFVMRRPVHRPLERVLVATDLSELSADAHERGLDAAAALLGEPWAVRSLLVIGPGSLPAPLPPGALGRTAQRELRSFLAERRPRLARVQGAVRTGVPADEIVAEADGWKANLLVMGTHGHVLLGSVAETVASEAPCSVLAVPPTHAGADAAAPETGLAGWPAEFRLQAHGREAAVVPG
jgi:nucleotide-binding universal stress UspA family protein